MADDLMTETQLKDLIPIYHAQYMHDVIPYYLTTVQGHIVDCNTAFLSLLGIKHDMVMDKTLEDLGVRHVNPTEIHETPLMRDTDSELAIRLTLLIPTLDQPIVATSVLRAVLTSSKKINGFICRLKIPATSQNRIHVQHESESKPQTVSHNENKTLQTKKSAEEIFHAELMHDIKNGFANLNILTYLIKNKIPEEEHQYIERLESQIKQIQDILLQVRLSDPVIEQPGLQNLHSVIRDIIAIHIDRSQENNIDLVYINSVDNILVDLSRHNLYRLFSNLISNAIKFTKNGEVMITVQYDQYANMAEVTISDTGIGIPATDLSNIFEANFRSSHALENNIEGTGIGLSIVKHIVEGVGGTIRCTSQVNAGTIFTVELPCKIIG